MWLSLIGLLSLAVFGRCEVCEVVEDPSLIQIGSGSALSGPDFDDGDPEVNFSNVTVNHTENNTKNVKFNPTLHPFEDSCEHCKQTCCKSPYSGADCTCLQRCTPSCDFCSSPWHIAPEHFETPSTGNFQVKISVKALPSLQNYIIEEVQLTLSTMGLETAGLEVDLQAPGDLPKIHLKVPSSGGTAGDFDATFSDSNCEGCIPPSESFGAYRGKSALGDWILTFQDPPETTRSGFVAWVSLALRLNC
ncbi:unnamed protein product [Durusdinium trenchii]|uniref:Uncharacterized protein n=2 Tax=Durusdinium trenchii TaxID=1381693 RepID=A0ABP0JEY0_9DINO